MTRKLPLGMLIDLAHTQTDDAPARSWNCCCNTGRTITTSSMR